MVFTTPPAVTPVNGLQGQEAFIFSYDFDTDAPRVFARTQDYPLSAMQFMGATRTDLDAFRRRGGKLIIYSSVNDGIFSGVDIVDWYQKLMEEHRSAAQFARLFMVPNMAHCGGGPATDSFAANMLTAITSWVEHDQAPARIVAANTDTVVPFPRGGLFDPRVARNFPAGGSRPLCPYPQQARYKGSGATNDAANFECVTRR
jgi:feruloyl esterase